MTNLERITELELRLQTLEEIVRQNELAQIRAIKMITKQISKKQDKTWQSTALKHF